MALVLRSWQVGYSLPGRFPTKYWTLSAWESNRHLLDFSRTTIHGKAMAVTPDFHLPTVSHRWIQYLTASS